MLVNKTTRLPVTFNCLHFDRNYS